MIVLSPALRDVVGMRSGREPSNNGIDGRRGGGGMNTQNKRQYKILSIAAHQKYIQILVSEKSLVFLLLTYM